MPAYRATVILRVQLVGIPDQSYQFTFMSYRELVRYLKATSRSKSRVPIEAILSISEVS